MCLKNMILETKNSNVKGTIQLDYPVEGLSDFSEVVQLTFEIEPSVVNSNDIRVFYSELGANIDFAIQTKMRGTLLDFELKDNRISYRNSGVEGNFRFTDLIEPNTPVKNHSDALVLRVNSSDL